jgi:hypothetical protein
MRRRSLPPTGGGDRVLSASGICLPQNSSEARQVAPLRLALTVSVEAEAAGRQVVELVREECSQEITRRVVDRVATLRFLFPAITPRVPEFHAVMDELVAADCEDDVGRIMREPGSRGRPRDSLYFVGLVDLVIDEHPGWSAKQACEWIFENFERGEGLPGVPGAERLRNAYSEHRRYYPLWRQSLYVPPHLLTAEPWRRAGDQPKELRLDDYRLVVGPNAFIFHTSNLEVAVPPQQGDHNVEGIARSAEQPQQPAEPEQPGVPGKPSGRRIK